MRGRLSELALCFQCLRVSRRKQVNIGKSVSLDAEHEQVGLLGADRSDIGAVWARERVGNEICFALDVADVR